MEFIEDRELGNLKLFLREDSDERTLYYIFEKNINHNNIQQNDIVGNIQVKKAEKIIDFTINNWWNAKIPVNYQNKGYGLTILKYVKDILLQQFNHPIKWKITIANSSELYERMNAKLESREQKENKVHELDR